MRLRVADIEEFVSSIYNYIIENYGIVPREFEGSFDEVAYESAVAYDGHDDALAAYDRPRFNDRLHVHPSDLIFCATGDSGGALHLPFRLLRASPRDRTYAEAVAARRHRALRRRHFCG